jgi:catabolite regulation protein CreA
MKKAFVKSVACYVIAGFFLMSAAPRVDAGFLPSEAIPSCQQKGNVDLQNIRKTLESKMVRERLNQLGFSEDEIQMKLSQLDDEQIHQLALSIDEIKVGGNGFEVLVILLLIGILIGVWFHLSGKRLVVQ